MKQYNIPRPLIRISAFVLKELAAILRQPRLIFTLILGPFLILLIFGIGYRTNNRTLKTVFVAPEQGRVRELVDRYGESLGQQIEFVGVTTDEAEASASLQSQAVDLVVVTPTDPLGNLRASKQSVFQLYHYEIDPYEETYVRLLGREYTNIVNEEVLIAIADQGKVEAESFQVKVVDAKAQTAVIRQALEAGEPARAVELSRALNDDVGLLVLGVGSGIALFTSVGGLLDAEQQAETDILARLEGLQANLLEMQQMDTGKDDFSQEVETAVLVEEELGKIDGLLTEFRNIDSRVLVTPFRSEASRVTRTALDPTHFFVPGVIALLLQHIAITLGGLSIVRERRDGALELFRAAPVSAFETLLGKYISYLILTSLLALVLTLLVVFLLQVPIYGHIGNYILVLLGLLLASLGFGFLLSLLAETDSQAIQYAMIMLLSSIFFSGFLLALYRLWTPVHLISWSLPATYGTSLLQSVMLRGQIPSLLQLGGLYAIAILLFVVSWWRLGRLMARE